MLIPTISLLVNSNGWIIFAYLVEVGANPTLPILAEVWSRGQYNAHRFRSAIGVGVVLTVVHDLLVVLDRL
jgi:hypothetical protein